MIKKTIPPQQKYQYPIDKNAKDIIKSNNKEDNKDIREPKKQDSPDYQYFIEKWNKAAEYYGLSKITTLSDARKKKIKTRLKNDKFKNGFIECLKLINKSSFLKGDNSSWKITFDWLICNEDNWIKVLEGNYTDKQKSKPNKAESYENKIPNKKETTAETKLRLEKLKREMDAKNVL